MSPCWGYLRHTQRHTHILLGSKLELSVHRPYSTVTLLLFRTSGEKTSSALFPVQLTPTASKWCARVEGACGGQQLPLNSSIPFHRHCYTHTYTLPHGRYGASAFCQGVLSHRPLGPLSLGGNLVFSLHLHRHPLPTDEKENRTWGGHCSSSFAVVSHIFFAISVLRLHALLYFSFFCLSDQ